MYAVTIWKSFPQQQCTDIKLLNSLYPPHWINITWQAAITGTNNAYCVHPKTEKYNKLIVCSKKS